MEYSINVQFKGHYIEKITGTSIQGESKEEIIETLIETGYTNHDFKFNDIFNIVTCKERG